MKDLERCRTCGGVLERRGDYFVCQSCGHKYEVDITDNATLIDKEHAWSVFRSMDFEKAIDLFESIVSKQPDNYEAHWGLALSMAEVFFTLDKDKNKMIPTMLSISESSFVENKNVQKAISLAPKAISEGYSEVAAYIEKVRVEWIEKASKQAPFDVFISFKASDGEDKHKTSDLDAARDIYDILRDQKYNVFFSPITLKGKAGEEFEPYIYNAIQTAKVMIVYGEKAEYYTSTWIKNEWSRYKKMIESGKKHKDSLFVVSKGVKPEDISPSLVRGREILHADDMRFSEILKLQVKRVIDEVEQSKKLSKKEVEAKKREKKDTLPKNAADRREIGGAGAETSIDEKESLSLIPFYISQGQWDAALALVNDVLSKNASCAEAMWNKMMLDRKYRSEAELIGKLSELSADEFNMIDEMLRCAGREFAAHMLDLLYDSGKTLNSSVYERVLRLVLPYDYPSREGKIKEAIERSIKNSELALFTMLLDSLDSSAVEDYKNYNFKYIQTTPNREEKKTCANKILEVEDNIEAYNIIYQYHFEGSRRSEDMVSAFETMLQYTDVGERAGVVCRAIDEAAKKMRSSAQCECAYEIIGFYPGDTKEIKDKILMLADAALQLELYDQARHLYNIVAEVDPRNVSARWGICLARVHARNESEVIRSDRPLIQQQPDFNKFLSLLGEADRKKYGALTIKQEKHHKSKNKRLAVTLLAIAAAIALCVGAFFAVKAINDANYNNAISLLEQGDYEGAYSLLEGVFGYEDADKYIEILDNVSLLGESEDIKATLAALSDLGVSVEISYDAKGGSSHSSQSFAGGDEISFVTPERTGYEFEKWSYVSHSYKFKNQTVSISLAASWTASKNTEYRVSYYIEDEKTGEFSLHSTVSHRGETDASVTPAPMSIDGYAPPEAITAKIAADGSLEIKYYYYSKNTQYIVNHYVENVGDEGYTLESSETLKGTTNSSVTPETRSYSGYVSPAKQTVTILPGGTLVVDYYYQRADYTITVVPNCETSSYEVGFKWGDQFNIVDPERSGYTFGGWYTDVELTVPYLPEISSSVTIYAHWLEETKASDFTYDGADEYTILGYQGQGASITVPAYIGGKPVRRIIDGAFADNKTITDVVIPDTVNRIGYAAFAGCTALKSITVPFIGESESATEGYNTTLGFIFGDKNPTDGGYASSSSTHYTSGNYGYTSQAQDTGYTSSTYYYYYLIPKSLKSVTVTRQTSIPECAFKNCDLLESITIPEGVTSIGACALMGCENLLSLNSTTAGEVNVPNGVTTIAYKAFSYLYAITAINLPENVKTIEDHAFYGCSKVSAYNGKANALELPSGVTSVGALAFYNNSLIKTIVVPDSVTTIGWAAFGGCSSLESLTVPFIGESMNTTTEYSITLGHFFGDKSPTDSGCDSSSSAYTTGGTYGYTSQAKNTGYTSSTYYYYYLIPRSLKSVTVTLQTSIAPDAFRNCDLIESITIPETVTSIGNSAFRGCNNLSMLNSTTAGEFVIPEGVKTIESSVFYYCYALSAVKLPAALETIGDYALYGCSKLASVNGKVTTLELPDSVTSIGALAFYNNSLIKTIVVPDSVTTIGWAAFGGCTSLESLTVPFIGESMNTTTEYSITLGHFFGDKSPTDSGCDSSSSAYTTSGTYGYTSQAKNTGYTSSTYYYYYLIPRSLKSVTVTLQTSIAPDAFRNCDLIESITIPTSTTSIGSAAFYDCKNLSMLNSTTAGEFVIPEGVKTIEGSVFKNCSAVSAIKLPAEIDSIGEGAFYGCSKVSAYNGKANALELPSGVTSIGALAFYKNSLIKTVVVPDSVTTIGWAAFGGCTSLESLTVPFIGESMSATTEYNITLGHFFGDGNPTNSGCESSSSAYTTSGTYGYTSQGQNTGYTSSTHYYYYLIPRSLKSVTVTLQTTVSPDAFRNCDLIESITIPETVTSIGSSAFYGCNNLSTLNSSTVGEFVIPDGIKTIEKAVFYNCYALVSVKIPSSVDSIGSRAFYGCSQLATFNGKANALELPSGVTSIGALAFYKNSLIKTIVVPDSVTTIGWAAFGGCTSLESLTVPFIGESINATAPYNTTLGYIFGDNSPTDSEYSSTSSVYATSGSSGNTSQAKNPSYTSTNYYYFYMIPKSLKKVTVTLQTTVAPDAFRNCDLIESITIPTSTTSIGSAAFYGCKNLSMLNSTTRGEFVIPNGVETIADHVFYNCYALGSITLPENLEAIGAYAFYGCSKLASVNGKANTIELPDGITTIGTLAFCNNSLIKTIVVPESVTTIGWAVFSGCTSLESLTVPFIGERINATTPYNTTLGHFFGDGDPTNSGCESTSTVYKTRNNQGYTSQAKNPDYTSSNYYYYFIIPQALKNVTVTVQTEIPDYAFSNCNLLETVTIKTGASVGTDAFKDCTATVNYQ